MRNLQFTVTTLICLLQAHQRKKEQLRGTVTGAEAANVKGTRRRNRKESKNGVGTGKRRRNKEQEQGKVTSSSSSYKGEGAVTSNRSYCKEL